MILLVVVFGAGVVLGFGAGVIGMLAADEMICRRNAHALGRKL